MTEVLRMTITGKTVWTAPLGRAATTARPAPRLAPQSCEGAVGDWLYKIVAGIQPAAIRLTPTPRTRSRLRQGALATGYGPVECR
jgi:hypothetical protein